MLLASWGASVNFRRARPETCWTVRHQVEAMAARAILRSRACAAYAASLSPIVNGPPMRRISPWSLPPLRPCLPYLRRCAPRGVVDRVWPPLQSDRTSGECRLKFFILSAFADFCEQTRGVVPMPPLRPPVGSFAVRFGVVCAAFSNRLCCVFVSFI